MTTNESSRHHADTNQRHVLRVISPGLSRGSKRPITAPEIATVLNQAEQAVRDRNDDTAQTDESDDA